MTARPGSILFLCSLNAIRSPMAEQLARAILPSGTYVASAGVRKGERDPFVDAVLAERGLDLGKRLPQTLDELEDDYFDLVVSLSPEAHHKAVDMMRTHAGDLEFWPLHDPSDTRGTRDQILGAYRDVRDLLEDKIRQRFALPSAGTGGK
ncbi:MAG: protein-tyrosine-phosphatase [Phyllobacteriaceae bacterium]|uniref:arsenate-mycothiol transferase ArsC n=1 Tax=Zhengella sedimenti TaxID=3390035 RepID=UPI000C37E764|nr:protein-tyrosine-phosphatase [Phyllobacteriaceae bacterium]MBA90650.1 protein-tyrosine-phosphatase [Phyllobacteriaceae bacterium]